MGIDLSRRARGTPRNLPHQGLRPRFIPACAGNTDELIARLTGATVHPRVRGEHNGPPSSTTIQAGSSPRARGTLFNSVSRHRSSRFIPACAGNTWCWPVRGPSAAVHPRVRGEHRPGIRRESTPTGSSPRARGTPPIFAPKVDQIRFIPACAGNTVALGARPRVFSVHPRVRGEHRRIVVFADHDRGSSPRARGTQRSLCGGGLRRRFIPACAGNTDTEAAHCVGVTVHPRVRGEHVGLHQLREFGARFIPACAGNTPASP